MCHWIWQHVLTCDNQSTRNKRSEKINWTLSKSKHFHSSKDTIKKVKDNQNEEKISAHPTYLIFVLRIYKELLQINDKKKTQLKSGQRT